MRVIVVSTVRAAVLLTAPVFFFVLSPALHSHFQKGQHLSSTAVRTSKHSLEMALHDGIFQQVVRELWWGQLLVVSLKARESWAQSNMRYNFGCRKLLSLSAGVSRHFLKRKRTGGGSRQVFALAQLATHFLISTLGHSWTFLRCCE